MMLHPELDRNEGDAQIQHEEVEEKRERRVDETSPLIFSSSRHANYKAQEQDTQQIQSIDSSLSASSDLAVESKMEDTEDVTVDSKVERVDVSLSFLHYTFLRQVILWSSVMAIPITVLSMSVLHQFEKDLITQILIICFWFIPILIIIVSLILTKSNITNVDLMWYMYAMYTLSFYGIFVWILVHLLYVHGQIDILREYLKKREFWCEIISEVFLCNVVISDALYSLLY